MRSAVYAHQQTETTLGPKHANKKVTQGDILKFGYTHYRTRRSVHLKEVRGVLAGG